MSEKIETLETNPNKRREIQSTLDEINKKYEQLSATLDKLCVGKTRSECQIIASDFFKQNTNELKGAIQSLVQLGTDRSKAETDALHKALPKAYALVKLASRFLWDKPHFDSQIKGGILINDGYVSEMATGEGKTLTAALPAYLNALLGKGVHVITTNGYLARANHEEMSQLYNLLGLSCGLVEDRNVSLDEEIEEIKKEKLKSYVEKYASRAKTKEERRFLEKKFYTDRANFGVIVDAEKMARKEARAQYISKRRKAYDADITYGAAEVFAFDYLYDDIAKDYSGTVQRSGRPYFAITDEVDSVLVDTATSPFILSGTQSDASLDISEEEKKEINNKIRLANFAVYKIFMESLKAKDQDGEALVSMTDDDNFDALEPVFVDDEKADPDARRIVDSKAIIVSPKSKRFKLTTLGETIIFQYYCDHEINPILDKYCDEIVKLKDGNGLMFQIGKDYTIDANGHIKMNSTSLYRLIKTKKINELNQTFDKFATDELYSSSVIDNAITAWFVLKENGANGDYILKIPEDAENSNQRIIALTNEGRTAEGRVYSNGLQQAIEAKERILKPSLEIVPTKISTTLASIPTSSFFARYEKFSGMTGTAAVGIFKNLYNLTTFAVPRNKRYIGIDHGDKLYLTRTDKFKAIYDEVKKSHIDGQPVLIATTSIKESEELQQYVIRRFSEDFGQDNVPQIPVLNARVDDLSNEAKIVSRAGLPGAITITTEMAGRGTDIKLGGEALTEEEAFDALVDASLANYHRGHVAKEDDRKIIEQKLASPFNPQRELILDRIHKIMENSKIKSSKLKKEVMSVGGLKVIGTGHFVYSRVDNQVKGRCARQGDPGEIIFFDDIEGLEKIGVPRSVTEKFEKIIKSQSMRPIVEDETAKDTPILDAVYEAQCHNESMVEMGIKQQQDIENEMAKYRSELHDTKSRLLKEGSYIGAMEKLVGSTADAIMRIADVPEAQYGRKRTSKEKIDFDRVIALSSEFLGVDFTKKELVKCKRVDDLRKMISESAVDKFEDVISAMPRKDAEKKCSLMFERIVSRGWASFEEVSDSIRKQRSLNALVQRQSGFDNQYILGASIMDAYSYCFESETAVALREIINPDYKEKGYDSTALRKMQVTADGFEEITEKTDAKNDGKEEKTMTVRNLSPTAKMFASTGKTTINRDSSRVGRISMGYSSFDDDDVASVDFSNSSSSRNRR